MTTVAIVADIHGNVPALEAVISELARLEPDEVLVGGDLVGRGPQGSRVVRRVRELGWRSILGNHEEYLLDFHHRRVPEAWWHAEEWSAARWMAAELDEESAAYIASLPFSARPAAAPGLLLVHGSPDSTNEGIGPWTSDRDLARHLAGVPEPLLVCAHTHRPLHRRRPEGELVNVGSVGLPFNGDRRAQFGLFHWDGERWSADLRAVPYDVERARRAFRDTGFLAAGGVTARLLDLELEHARPFVVPFQKWAEHRGHHPGMARMREFLALYDPTAPLHDFLRLLSVPR
ncbi:MAG: metallophosphoesterase family protein [Thermoanaerobaculia bacterium]|nr:metallophosphoesterase family protein [Thermoanaerobaculia bacterium]